jgi:hypothetical protein
MNGTVHAVHVAIADIPFTDFGNNAFVENRKASMRRAPVGQLIVIVPIVFNVSGNDFDFLMIHRAILYHHASHFSMAIRLILDNETASAGRIAGQVKIDAARFYKPAVEQSSPLADATNNMVVI